MTAFGISPPIYTIVVGSQSRCLHRIHVACWHIASFLCDAPSRSLSEVKQTLRATRRKCQEKAASSASITHPSWNAVARIDGPMVDIEPFGRRTARHSRLFELASPRGRVAMPCRHVLDMGLAEGAGMEKPAVVVGIEMMRLHEPHQVH